MDDEHYELVFHGPNSCNHVIHRSHELRAHEHLDQDGHKLVYAHIILRDDEADQMFDGMDDEDNEFDDDERQQALSDTPTATIAIRASSRRTANASTTKKRKPTVKYTNPAKLPVIDYSDDDETEDVEYPTYIRIGTYPWSAMNQPKNDVEDEKKIELEAIMAAQVKTEIDKVRYVLINSWTINGVQLGHTSMRELHETVLFDSRGEAQIWQPDQAFSDCTSMADVKKKVISFIKGPNRSRPLPTEPTKVYSGEPYGLNRTSRKLGARSRKEVGAIVAFRNLTGLNINLNLDVNLQPALEHNETYESFEDYIYNGDDDKFPGLVEILSKKLERSWQVGIWVIPQIRGTDKMYSWTRLKDWVASDWLNTSMEEQFGRELYIEVQIAPKPLDDGTINLSTLR